MMNLSISTSPACAVPSPAVPVLECASCSLRKLCLPEGIADAEFRRMASLVSARRTLRQGETLFRDGDRFVALYAVRTGFLKTHIGGRDGRDQVTAFQMAGDLLGLDGVASERHTCNAVALEDSQVCMIPYAGLESLCREVPGLLRQFHRVMGREIVRDQRTMLLLAGMRAEERLAAFILNLTSRLRARGFSAVAVVLRMSREEIGSFLGLKLETVSRTFSKLQDAGILDVRQRHVRVVDADALQWIVDGGASHRGRTSA